jgi:hypothetical protein
LEVNENGVWCKDSAEQKRGDSRSAEDSVLVHRVFEPENAAFEQAGCSLERGDLPEVT